MIAAEERFGRKENARRPVMDGVSHHLYRLSMLVEAHEAVTLAESS